MVSLLRHMSTREQEEQSSCVSNIDSVIDMFFLFLTLDIIKHVTEASKIALQYLLCGGISCSIETDFLKEQLINVNLILEGKSTFTSNSFIIWNWW